MVGTVAPAPPTSWGLLGGMADAASARPVLDQVWQGLADESTDALELTGSAALPGAFRVADAAAASAGAALLAASRWLGARRARLDVGAATGAFLADRRLLVDGHPPQFWDPIAGDYPAADGWVRLHTNYPRHRAAALRALGLPASASRDDVAAAVAGRRSPDVEQAVVDAGGAAGALRSRQEWRAHPQAVDVARRPLVAVWDAGTAAPAAPPAGRPRVLDLTRVIAAPTATKVLAAVGADVLRVDAPGFEELPALVAETTAGKLCARLDVRARPAEFAQLVAAADVLVCGLRPGALTALGWPPDRLAEVNPGLVLAELSAYGDTGPWAGRRGFDSLVQMVSGVAHEGMLRAGADRPVPLPAQALDHAGGWLLAAGVLRALSLRRDDGRGRGVGVVLARTGQWLDGLGRQEEPPAGLGAPGPVEEVLSPLGRVTRVTFPGELDGRALRWAGPPSPLGSAAPRFPADLTGRCQAGRCEAGARPDVPLLP
jgi:crotonobetainyl-CoA:carnitine CoA-transferase CaiB-like acyl-CoA transferase